MSYSSNLMEKIFDLDRLHDFQMIAADDGKRFDVHRLVIEASCMNFYEKCKSGQQLIMVQNATGRLLEKVIEFIYHGHIELTMENAFDLLIIGHELGIGLLRKQCTHYLSDHLTPNDCVDVLTIASEYAEFELFCAAWRYMCEQFEQIEYDMIVLYAPNRTNETTFSARNVILDSMQQNFGVIESKHMGRIPEFLQSIRLKYVSSPVIGNVLAPLYAEHGMQHILINEYRRRAINPGKLKQFMSSERIHCAHYSSETKLLIVHRYDGVEGWVFVKSILCVGQCVRYVFNQRKLFIIFDQGSVRIVESHDLHSSHRAVCSRVLDPPAGHQPIVIDDYIYFLGGVGWTTDVKLSDTLDRLYTVDWDRSHSWEECESMPIQKHRYTAIALNGVIYVGGGESKRRFCDQFICYDTTDGEWKEKAPLQFNSTNAILFTSNQRLYAVDNKSITHKYDDDEDSWTQLGLFERDNVIAKTIDYGDETYGISRNGNFGIVNMDDIGGRLQPINRVPFDFDPFHLPILFID